MRGKSFFITFEGPEGSGKSTHSLLLSRWLEKNGHRILLTREPGGSPLAEVIREILLNSRHHPDSKTELLLYIAARRDHVRNRIMPALQKGRTVICDRFSEATMAYQGYGRGLPKDWVGRLDRWAREGLAPDLTILIDVPVSVGLALARARKGKRGGDRLERESKVFHERVRKGYLALARRNPSRIKVVRRKPTIQETFEEILKIAKRRMSF